MTEIQFLLHLLMEQKPSPAIKKLILARIGEVEANLTKPTTTSNKSASLSFNVQPVPQYVVSGEPPPVPKPREIPPVTLVSAGDGIKAPRKW